MNEIGVVILGAAARGTVFASIGLCLCLAIGRRGRAASGLIALGTLVGMVGVTAAGASPWLRWWSLESSRVARSAGSADRAVNAPVVAPEVVPDLARTSEPIAAIKPAVEPAETGLGAAFRVLGMALLQAPEPEVRSGWGWQAWVAVGAMAGIGVGLVRFGFGLLAVRMLRRGSRPLEDDSMRELADRIRAELGLARAVGVRIAPGLATPATIGWLRPVVLLPEDWKSWDDRERRVVLAHEFAHIRNNDYISGLWAQLCLALHYYHPLAHWLAGRLRLEQELAADACGASLSGGNRPYLTALARLALRNDPRPVGWPARSFRPGRGTFLRRIEMLRDVNESRGQAPLGRWTRVLTLGTLAMAGLAIAGLRGPGSTGKAEAAQAPAAPAVAKPGVTLEHGLIPADTAGIAVIRPAELLRNPDLARFVAELEPIKILHAKTGLKPTDLEQFTVLWTFDALKGGPRGGPMTGTPSGAIFRMTGPQGWKEILTKSLPGLTEAKFGDVTYFELKEGPNLIGFGTPDDRTLVIAESPMLFRILAAKPGAADHAAWADAWKAVKKGQAAVAVDVSAIAFRLRPDVNRGPDAAIMTMFNPLLERANAYALSLDTTKTLSLDGIATCNNAENARQVAETLKAVLTLGRNAIESFRSQPGQASAGIAPIINVGRPILEKAVIVSEGTKVELSASSDLQLGQIIKLLVPSVEVQRASARRAQSVNNLKQIGLAFFNYASANGKFPAATIIGPDGKTPHSWRVEILPYMEQQAIYNQYKLDEPWDSPSNRKLLEHIPIQYRFPGSKSATSSSYYVLTGKDTLFPGNEGSRLAEITDGTSNTIMAFEADREIPWTKPEDIPFDANGALPKLGGLTPGGTSVLYADGSVGFIKETINPIVLKALFTRAGGEVISRDSF